ncbi:hypothetical protein KCU59_g3, partial [Aureobasidium melanogenum]
MGAYVCWGRSVDEKDGKVRIVHSRTVKNASRNVRGHSARRIRRRCFEWGSSGKYRYTCLRIERNTNTFVTASVSTILEERLCGTATFASRESKGFHRLGVLRYWSRSRSQDRWVDDYWIGCFCEQ